MNRALGWAMCVVCLHAWPAMGQRAGGMALQDASKRTISVSGESEIRVVPDEVVLTLGVETFDADLQASKADNDARVAAILAAMRERRVPDERVRTDFLQLEPRYRSQTDRLIPVGYVVRKTIVVTLREVATFDAVLGAAVAAGATHVHGIDFRTTELRAHRDRARALAIDAAREKAEAMAGRLGQRVGPPLTIAEGHSGWWSGYGSGWGARGSAMTQNVVQDTGGEGAGDGTISPGQIAIKGNVTVTFELIR
jgi:uncharacterized protein